VDGDAHCYSIAAASIVAKTVRDRIMRCLAGRHPAYGWGTNVGYGTPEHLAGLASVGPTRHHRMTFAPCVQTELWSGVAISMGD
jgi:ribonuclease HII